jgi:hypothetical protein
MNDQDAAKAAHDELTRVLGFFARVDAKATALFAIGGAMLGAVALNLKLEHFANPWLAVPVVLTVCGVFFAMVELYRSSFPDLEGGERSLIYFREIGARTEGDYIRDFYQLTDEAYAKELLAQNWRNSKILRMKFDRLKVAFIAMALSLLPMTAFLVGCSIVSGSLPSMS